jgi:nicotinate dehydrogenase subunit B
MSKAVGAPVRVQFMRGDEHGWDNYGPAQLVEIRMAMNASAKIQAYEVHGWQHGWTIVETSEQLALGTSAADTSGPIAQEVSPFNLGAMYEIPNRLLVNHRIPGVNG